MRARLRASNSKLSRSRRDGHGSKFVQVEMFMMKLEDVCCEVY